MSDDVKDELKKLKEEIAGLKDQLDDFAEKEHRKSRSFHIDIESPIHDYIDDVMQGVAEGVHGELEKSIFIGPRGCRILRPSPPFHEGAESSVNFAKVAQAMSALGHEHRMKILNELMTGGRYINELQEKLSEITTSTLSSHLNVLEEAGLVVQEKVRGRYLITMPGRTAYTMALKVARFLDVGEKE